MPRDPDRDELPNPKKWDETDDDPDYDTVDTSEVKKAGSGTEVKNRHKSPPVRTKDPEPNEYEDEQTASFAERAKYTLEVVGLRGRNVLSRLLQLTGFYLMFASVIYIFAPVLTEFGVPVGGIPDVVFQPIIQSGIPPVLMILVGFFIVWFSTSVWFLNV